MRRSTNLSLHTLHALHDKFDTRRAVHNGATGKPCFLSGVKRIAPGPSPSPEQGCTAPGTLSASCPALPTPTLRRQPFTLPSSPAHSHPGHGRPDRTAGRSSGRPSPGPCDRLFISPSLVSFPLPLVGFLVAGDGLQGNVVVRRRSLGRWWPGRRHMPR